MGRSSRKDLKKFPLSVRKAAGYAIWLAQKGDRHESTKILKGFGGAGVLEVVEDSVGSTFRVVYSVKFVRAVYVLHAFQKKSTKGIATPKPILDVVRDRLKWAEKDYEKRYPKGDDEEDQGD